MKNLQTTLIFLFALILSAATNPVFSQTKTEEPCAQKGYDMLYVSAPFSKGPFGITSSGQIAFDGYEIFCDKMKVPTKKEFKKIKEILYADQNSADFPAFLFGSEINSEFLVSHRLAWLEAMPIPSNIRGVLFILHYNEKKKSWILIKIPEEGSVTIKYFKQ